MEPLMPLESTSSGRRIAVGTSGFAYDEWRGTFFPEKLPAKQFLSYYARHFTTTEINATFYRFPRVNVAEGWAQSVPPGFSFTLKMSQRVTHVKRLKDVDREMTWFCDGAYTLADKLGAVLILLPPNMKADVPRLDDFLSRHAARLPMAIEFRHDSWFEDATYEVLQKHRTALAVVEREDADTVARPRIVTGRFVYMRLRKGDYTDSELKDWADWILGQNVDTFCYLKHDLLAPVLAQRMLVHLGLLDPVQAQAEAEERAAAERRQEEEKRAKTPKASKTTKTTKTTQPKNPAGARARPRVDPQPPES
jgi:uncharacterized protein YecE (DUF72 family)